MKPSPQLKLALGLVLALPCVLLTGIPILAARSPQCPSSPAATASITQVNPPDLPQLAALALSGGMVAPDPETLQEEQDMLNNQVEQAKAWLDDSDEQQRLIGAEQFSAFPTPEAELYLREALQHDPADAVRAAAADSLAAFTSIKPETLDVLLSALQDFNEEVQGRAFSTLQILYKRTNPETTRTIHLRLKQLVTSGQLNYDNREAINEFLLDQTGS